ncbi:MAG: phosphatase PAP2 family protein [Rhodothermaceae bacterium]
MIKKDFKIIFFVVIILLSITTNAQNRYNFNQYFEETGDLLCKPSHWGKNDFIRLGSILGSAFLIMQIDETIRDEVLKDRSFYYTPPIEFARRWGEPLTTLVIAGGLSLQGLITDNKSNQHLAYEIMQSFSYTAGLTGALKLSLGRARPFTGRSPFKFEPFQHVQNAFRSFPSGHTSIAFSLSTVLAERTDSDFLKVVYYIPAVATAFSRVYQNHHWTSDVFIGACIGYFIGKFVTDLHNKTSKPENITAPPSNHFSLTFQF